MECCILLITFQYLRGLFHIFFFDLLMCCYYVNSLQNISLFLYFLDTPSRSRGAHSIPPCSVFVGCQGLGLLPVTFCALK